MTKTKSDFINAINRQYRAKSAYYRRLALCLDLSSYWIADSEIFDDGSFPPAKKALELCPLLASEESVFDLEVDISKDKIAKKGNKESALITLEDCFNKLRASRIDDDCAFKIIFDCCLAMAFLCEAQTFDNDFEDEIMDQVEELGRSVNAKAYELLGYWTGKMEEKRRNKSFGGLAKTNKCEERIKRLADEVTKLDTSEGRELIIERSEFERMCREISELEKINVSYPTLKKYKEGVETKIGKKIELRKK